MAANGKANGRVGGEPTFLDLLPGGEKVAIPGGEVEILGVSIGGIGFIARQFPDVVEHLLTSGGKLDGIGLVAQIPRAIPLLIAAGMGEEENATVVKWASRQPIHVQVDLVSAVIRRTMGADDYRPLVEKVKGLLKLAGAEELMQSWQTELPEPAGSLEAEDSRAA
jgi:hypothetical protein